MSRLAVIGVGALAVLVAGGVSALMLTSSHATDLVPTALHGPTARTVLVALRSGE